MPNLDVLTEEKRCLLGEGGGVVDSIPRSYKALKSPIGLGLNEYTLKLMMGLELSDEKSTTVEK